METSYKIREKVTTKSQSINDDRLVYEASGASKREKSFLRLPTKSEIQILYH